MTEKVDTHGYLIRGLREVCGEIKKCVKRKELYYIYYDLATMKLSINEPAGYSATKVLLLESGVYEMSQQELADMVVDRLKKKIYNNVIK